LISFFIPLLKALFKSLSNVLIITFRVFIQAEYRIRTDDI